MHCLRTMPCLPLIPPTPEPSWPPLPLPVHTQTARGFGAPPPRHHRRNPHPSRPHNPWHPAARGRQHSLRCCCPLCPVRPPHSPRCCCSRCRHGCLVHVGWSHQQHQRELVARPGAASCRSTCMAAARCPGLGIHAGEAAVRLASARLLLDTQAGQGQLPALPGSVDPLLACQSRCSGGLRCLCRLMHAGLRVGRGCGWRGLVSGLRYLRGA
jgi:hypothetical protein